jgi:hypothetical protein
MTEIKKPKSERHTKATTTRKRNIVTDEVRRKVERRPVDGVDDVGDELLATKAAFSDLEKMAAGFIRTAAVLAPQVESSAEALSNAKACLIILQQHREMVDAAVNGVKSAVVEIRFSPRKYEDDDERN